MEERQGVVGWTLTLLRPFPEARNSPCTPVSAPEDHSQWRSPYCHRLLRFARQSHRSPVPLQRAVDQLPIGGGRRD